MTQIAGPYRLCGIATTQHHAHHDLLLLHHALAVFFLVGRIAAAVDHHMHIVQVQIDLGLIQIGNAGIAHSGQDAA